MITLTRRNPWQKICANYLQKMKVKIVSKTGTGTGSFSPLYFTTTNTGAAYHFLVKAVLEYRAILRLPATGLALQPSILRPQSSQQVALDPLQEQSKITITITNKNRGKSLFYWASLYPCVLIYLQTSNHRLCSAALNPSPPSEPASISQNRQALISDQFKF